ncbi:hypothetical protein PAXRUDRAFT_159730, partial [Paxillus rubicundulus Ve08.2h10]
TISADLKARIPVLHHFGDPVHQICHLLGIKKTLVYKTLQLYQAHQTNLNPLVRIPARRRMLNTTDITFLSALLHRHPTMYLDELQHELRFCRVDTSIPTLHRTLCRLNITHKCTSARVLERNEDQQAVFMNFIAEIAPDPNMLMFEDEAAKNERTLIRPYGRARMGICCVQWKCFVRGTHYSIVPIITLDGIITYKIIEGPVTSEFFYSSFMSEL